jgi:hypothetical protein
MIRRLIIAAAVTAMLVFAGTASAGRWVQISCVNPDGSASSSEGWTSSATGGPGYGSSNGANCSMFAALGATNPEPVNASEILQYTPPAGSTLIGGTVNVDLHADGGGYNASGTAVLYEPAFVYPDDVFFQCASGLANCSATGHDYNGPLTLPSNRGGSLYVVASCGGNAGAQCTTGDSNGLVSSAVVSSAQFLLQNDAVPQAVNITGTALGSPVTGTGHLLMNASDPNGPGVYQVVVAIDGVAVYSGTPNDNNGTCVSHGVDTATGALMFDGSQPCPASEQVSVPVPTTAFPDGRHELTAAIIDAAGNRADVLDQYITTSNPRLTPAPKGKGRVHMRLKIKWKYFGATTHASQVVVLRSPRRGKVSLRCAGKHCPKIRVRSGAVHHLKKLIASLTRTHFKAGQKLLITITSPHLRRERIQLTMRYNHWPSAKLLK